MAPQLSSIPTSSHSESQAGHFNRPSSSPTSLSMTMPLTVSSLVKVQLAQGLHRIARSGLLNQDSKNTILVPTKAARDDREWTVSMGLHNMVNCALGLLYVLSLVSVRKPLACLLLQLESLSRAVVSVCRAALNTAVAKIVMASMAVIAFSAMPWALVLLETAIHLVGGLLFVSTLLSLQYRVGL